MNFKTTALAAVVCLATGWDASARAAEGSFERTLSVSGPVEMDVSTGSGSIEIREEGSGKVHIRGRIRSSNGWFTSSRRTEERIRALEENPPIEQNGNYIRIGHIRDRDLRRNISISYEITVPAETKLDSNSGSGSQRIRGISGPLEANAGSGSLTIEEIENGVDADTGSGSIDIRSVSGGVIADAGSGSVVLEDVSGHIEVETGSGGVRINRARGSLDVQTGSGGIRAYGKMEGEWRLKASSGDVHIRLSKAASFDFDCRTSSGGIQSDHPVTIQGRMSRNELSGSVGGGGDLLHVRTSSGDIRIESP